MTGNALDNSQSFNCTKPESNEIKYDGQNLDSSEQKSMDKYLGLKSCFTSINSIVLEDGVYKCY
jgi:hypothetical protein